ncbi:MAG: cysteine--tRNA ligase [Candidatus Hodarchaeota archaeon]
MEIYNTLSRKKEPFKPLHEGKVRMYVCGPTVYDSSHLGHARSIVAFDVIRRYLEYKDLDVRFIQNFTDIDDKMIQRAHEQGVSVSELATKYIQEYFEDFDKLGVKRATAFPKATQHIDDMIEYIQKLVKKGFAYEAEGSVYFRVPKFRGYGKLSRQEPQEQAAMDADEAKTSEKENPADFALWKAMKPQEPYWESPWGKGRPGWHIECSVMAAKYLGEPIDIHGGGLDLVFPHHENEIAQSEALSGKPFVRYWMHNGFLTVNKEKMSKSLGNFFTIQEITARYDPEVVRLFLISSHYRSPIDFSDAQLEEAQARLTRIHNSIDLLLRRLRDALTEEAQDPVKPSEADTKLWQALEVLRSEFETAMDEDFNTPVALASLSTFLSTLNTQLATAQTITAGTLQKTVELLDEIGEVFGLYRNRMATMISDAAASSRVDDLVQLLIDLRNSARKHKDFATADRIRDNLKTLGILLEDGKTGTTWKVTK